MREIELKFQVPPERRAALRAAFAAREGARSVALQAAYFDTAGRALARAGMALRRRREGERWVQTLKAAGDDGLTRAEHDVEIAGDAMCGAPADPLRHAGTEPGERLLALLSHGGEPLQEVFRTDIRRRTRELQLPAGVVEFAFDQGRLSAGDRTLPVCELEIELESGSPLAVMMAARTWVTHHGLWLDTRSKAERGDMLARGESMAPPRQAGPVRLQPEMTLAQGMRSVLASCADQVAANASQIACGEHDAEHVHQLRVGLRRLRTALRLFADAFESRPRWAPLADDATWLFRSLGAARDLAAIARPMERELGDALQAAGLHFKAPGLPLAGEVVEPTALVRGERAQLFLLTLLEEAHDESAAPAEAFAGDTVGGFVVSRLRAWQRRARKQAARAGSLDDAARHQLRKRIKRLRYGIEFASALFERRRVKRALKPLRRLQDALGELVDLAVALAAYRDGSARDPHALFAVGWLAARKDRLLRKSRKPLQAFARSRFRRLAKGQAVG